VLELLPGFSVDGQPISKRTVARVHKNLWLPLWETKPYLVDVSYAGLLRELRTPWRGSTDDIIREIAALEARGAEVAARA